MKVLTLGRFGGVWRGPQAVSAGDSANRLRWRIAFREALVAALGVAGRASEASAWNDSGHMQVAFVAWQVLGKEECAKVVAEARLARSSV